MLFPDSSSSSGFGAEFDQKETWKRVQTLRYQRACCFDAAMVVRTDAWRSASPAPFLPCSGHKDEVYDLAWNPASAGIFSCAIDKETLIWTTSPGSQPSVLCLARLLSFRVPAFFLAAKCIQTFTDHKLFVQVRLLVQCCCCGVCE